MRKTISVTRLLKEVAKIEKIVTAEKSFIQIEKLRVVLNNNESLEMTDSVRQNSESAASFQRTSSSVESLLDQFQNCDISETLKPFKLSAISKCDEGSVNIYWEMLTGEEIERFKLMNRALCHKNPENLELVLKHLISSIEDYPPEFFFQPPDILQVSSMISSFVGFSLNFIYRNLLTFFRKSVTNMSFR